MAKGHTATSSLKVLRRGGCYILRVEDSVLEMVSGLRGAQYRMVANARATLTRLADEGLESVNNTEQFVFEGRFPDGTRAGNEIAVYAVKSYQLRVYGGFRTIDGELSFVCVESPLKKTDKADQAQLKRAAKSLGEHGDDAG